MDQYIKKTSTGVTIVPAPADIITLREHLREQISEAPSFAVYDAYRRVCTQCTSPRAFRPVFRTFFLKDSVAQLDAYCCQIDPQWPPPPQEAGPAPPRDQQVCSYVEGFSDAAYPIGAIVDLTCSIQSFLVGPPLANMSVEFVGWGGENYSAGIRQVRHHGPLMVEATLSASKLAEVDVRPLLNRALAITIVATPTTIAIYLVYGVKFRENEVESVHYRQYLWETFHPRLSLVEFQAACKCVQNVQRWAKDAAEHLKLHLWDHYIPNVEQRAMSFDF
jgi:hypothetical protein